MATNKHAVIRYQALDKCFRNVGKKYFIEDLMDACSVAIYEYSGSDVDISRRQIFDDIKFMESTQGWSISIDRRKDGRRIYYRYEDPGFSINNQLLNEEEELKLKEVLLTLSRFKGMPQFEWIDEMLVRLQSSFTLKADPEKFIEFDQNKYLKGIEYFSDFYNAIVYTKTLLINYKGFKQDKITSILFHPYYLKQYNNRWFVFGRIDNNAFITNIAIDRVQSITEAKKLFIHNDLVDFNEFFEDVVGVTVQKDNMPEIVSIRVSNDMFPYIETKPLHGSQKIKKKTKDYAIIEIKVIINFELISLLFSFGEAITVLQPKSIIDILKSKAKEVTKNYL